jgi:SAM-dependent methyltransferase
MRRVSGMYGPLAVHYDRIFSDKQYASEVAELTRIARREGVRPGARWLDVACGTGRHLEHLRRSFRVVGVDLSPAMRREARRRLPSVRLVRADMTSLALGETYDVVSCLFSAIGYLRTEREIERAFDAMAAHLAPGGVVLVEPWIDPAQFRPGHLSLDTATDGRWTIARASRSERRGDLSYIHFEYLLLEAGRPIRHVRETEVCRLTPPARLRALLERAGFRARWVRTRARPFGGRGLLVGVRRAER